MPARILPPAAFLIIAGIGCAATTTHEDLAAFLKAHEHNVSVTEVRIQAADLIDLNAPQIHEIHGRRRVVQPDGKISLQLLGEVRVAGLTAREAETKIENLLSPYYRNPKVNILVEAQNRSVYYVLGQVAGEGPYRHTGRDTLMHALATARPNNIAWKSRVKVIRPGPTKGERHEIRVNVDKMIKTGDTRMNILLEPGDIVYVPPTPMGWVGLRVQELLFPARPVFQAATVPAAFGDLPDIYNNNSSSNGNRTNFSGTGF